VRVYKQSLAAQVLTIDEVALASRAPVPSNPGPSDTAALVGEKIRLAREAAGLKQGELAARLRRTPTALSYWESGKRLPGIDDLYSIASELGREVSEFFPPPPKERQPIAAILRAVSEQMDSVELRRSTDAFLAKAAKLPTPPREIVLHQRTPLRAAQELLAKASVRSIPTQVERLAGLCGARVLGHSFQEDLEGLLVQLDDGPVIGFNIRTKHEGRRRFTIAHELGHLVLRHHERFHLDLGSTATDGHPPGYDWLSEREANDFAANLLMPDGEVRKQFRASIPVEELAERFEVSAQAMRYRLINLGLR
jgi:Zn-dependent peptidase ImmA (M78 family)/DNA-binding XRE family transcriptional regulator